MHLVNFTTSSLHLIPVLTHSYQINSGQSINKSPLNVRFYCQINTKCIQCSHSEVQDVRLFPLQIRFQQQKNYRNRSSLFECM